MDLWKHVNKPKTTRNNSSPRPLNNAMSLFICGAASFVDTVKKTKQKFQKIKSQFSISWSGVLANNLACARALRNSVFLPRALIQAMW